MLHATFSVSVWIRSQEEPMSESGKTRTSGRGAGTKNPTPKADQLRAMRQANFADAKPVRAPVQELREVIADIRATKPKKKRKELRHG